VEYRMFVIARVYDIKVTDEKELIDSCRRYYEDEGLDPNLIGDVYDAVDVVALLSDVGSEHKVSGATVRDTHFDHDYRPC
jgi:hypothetical protein